ncbi:vacuolar calcium ion transporter [Fusarium proliferatum]|uniref:Vacuolar calcium ion transporter n=1 Tax=Gibberella intermedia TaxID=948311 RepID=A0A365MWD2_GIBIN|nr:vacuolar calcium ion transporter [Fusarium proliferatum]
MMAWRMSLPTKWRIIIACALSLILFSAATVLHFIKQGSLLSLLSSILALVPLSFIVRFATAEIVQTLQSHYKSDRFKDLVTPFLGSISELCFVLVAVLRNEGRLAQMVVIGLAVSECLLTLGTGVFRGLRLDSFESHPIIIARHNSRLLLMSIITIVAPAVLNFASSDKDKDANLLARIAAIALLPQFFYHVYFLHLTYTRSVSAETNNSPEPPTPSSTESKITLKSLRTAALGKLEDSYESQLSLPFSLVLFVFSITLLLVDSIYITTSIESSNDATSTSFVPLIIIPIALSGIESILSIAMADEELVPYVVEAMTWSTMRNLFIFGPVAVILTWTLDASIIMTPDGFQTVVLGLAIVFLFSVLHYSPAAALGVRRPYGNPEGLFLITSFFMFAVASFTFGKTD